jgi:hypothetical protein
MPFSTGQQGKGDPRIVRIVPTSRHGTHHIGRIDGSQVPAGQRYLSIQ